VLQKLCRRHRAVRAAYELVELHLYRGAVAVPGVPDEEHREARDDRLPVLMTSCHVSLKPKM